jgi:hypothetical protein
MGANEAGIRAAVDATVDAERILRQAEQGE